MAKVDNLDVVEGEAVHHKELAGSYLIQGGVYDLASVVAATKGEQSDEDWNKRTMVERLDAIKAYLSEVEATEVNPDNGMSDGEKIAAFDKGATARGALETLRAFNQSGEAAEVEAMARRIAELEAENKTLRDAAADAHGASRSEVVGEGGGYVEPGENEVATSKPTLHGSINDLKRPY